MKFTVNMTIEVDEEENILPVNYNGKEGDEQALKDILRDYLFDIDENSGNLIFKEFAPDYEYPIDNDDESYLPSSSRLREVAFISLNGKKPFLFSP